MKKIVAYYRVSTKRQGESGLGLEGQEACVKSFAKQSESRIVATYTEVESGKVSQRPELAKAMGHAKLAKATLVVAKLDRLARNVAFLSSIMESSCDFVACDNPHANRLTIHILAAVAEAEAVAISERTKAALAAAKARGVKLGSARAGHWKGREHRRGWRAATKAAAVARRRTSQEAYGFLVPTLQRMRSQGETFQSIADWLNGQGHTTAVGKPWTPTAAYRVLQRTCAG